MKVGNSVDLESRETWSIIQRAPKPKSPPQRFRPDCMFCLAGFVSNETHSTGLYGPITVGLLLKRNKLRSCTGRCTAGSRRHIAECTGDIHSQLKHLFENASSIVRLAQTSRGAQWSMCIVRPPCLHLVPGSDPCRRYLVRRLVDNDSSSDCSTLAIQGF